MQDSFCSRNGAGERGAKKIKDLTNFLTYKWCTLGNGRAMIGYGGAGNGWNDGTGFGGCGTGASHGYEGHTNVNGTGYDGTGHSYRYGYGIKNINGHDVYILGQIPAVLFAVNGRAARGAILNADLTLTQCYFVNYHGTYFHGETTQEIRDHILRIKHRI